MKTKFIILISIFVGVVALDQWTKGLILSHFQVGEAIDVIKGFFQLAFVQNPGAAFGIMQQVPSYIREPFFIVIPILAFFIILFLFVRLEEDDYYQATAYSLILSGAVGNLIDRLRFGWVIDFLYFHWNYKYWWPAFNVADSCIVVGVCLLFIHSIFLTKSAN